MAAVEIMQNPSIEVTLEKKTHDVVVEPIVLRRVKHLANCHMILMGWVAQVCSRFRSEPTVFFMFYELYKKFCKDVTVDRDNLQVYGAACLSIAMKYHTGDFSLWDVVGDLTHLGAGAYTRKGLADVEAEVLTHFDWNVEKYNGFVHDEIIADLFKREIGYTPQQIHYIYYSIMIGFIGDECLAFFFTPADFKNLMNVVSYEYFDEEKAFEIRDHVKYAMECLDFLTTGKTDSRKGAKELSRVDVDSAQVCCNEISDICKELFPI